MQHHALRNAAIIFGILVLVGAGYGLQQYLTTMPLRNALNAAKDCALHSAAKSQLDAPSIQCRDAYRTAYLAMLQNDFKSPELYTSSISGPNTHLDPTSFPSRISSAINNHGDISLAENNTSLQYSISEAMICSDVLEPIVQGGESDCVFTLPSNGTLQSTIHNTAYFYVPFTRSGAYFGTSQVPSSYIFGACLESGQLHVEEVNNEGHDLYTLRQSTLQTTGSNPQTIVCQPNRA